MAGNTESAALLLERPEDFLSPQQRRDAIVDVLAEMIWRAMQETEKQEREKQVNEMQQTQEQSTQRRPLNRTF